MTLNLCCFRQLTECMSGKGVPFIQGKGFPGHLLSQIPLSALLETKPIATDRYVCMYKKFSRFIFHYHSRGNHPIACSGKPNPCKRQSHVHVNV